MHAVREDLLERQAAAAGLPLIKAPIPYPCPNEAYEAAMGTAMAQAKADGITAVAFGDLFLEDVRQYREARLTGTGIYYGAALSALKGVRPGGLPPFVVLPSPIGNTGVSVSHGQGAAYLGAKCEPFVVEQGDTQTTTEVHDAERPFAVANSNLGARDVDVLGTRAHRLAVHFDDERARSVKRKFDRGREFQFIGVTLVAGTVHVLRQPFGEARFPGDTDAVGVDHQMADRTRFGHRQHFKKVGMQGRFADGNLDYVRLALVANNGVEHRFDLGEDAKMLPRGTTFGVTDRALQIAVVADLNQR